MFMRQAPGDSLTSCQHFNKCGPAMRPCSSTHMAEPMHPVYRVTVQHAGQVPVRHALHSLMRQTAHGGAELRARRARRHAQPNGSGGVVEQIRQSQAGAAARRHRFYTFEPLLPATTGASPTDVDSAPSYMIEGDEAKHAVKALRLREGDEVELCDGAGCVARCAIAAVDKSTWRTWLSPLEVPRYEAWSGPEWVLAVGCLTLKGGRSEWLVEKATELGARELMPLSTARSLLAARVSKFKVKRGGSGDGFRGSGDVGGNGSGGDSAESYAPGGRLERVAVAATKQSLRLHDLLLRPPVSVLGNEGGDGLLEKVRRADVALLAAAGAPPASEVLREVLHARAAMAATTAPVTTPATASVGASNGSRGGDDGGDAGGGSAPPLRGLLLVGPEGDFTPEEVEALVAAGAKPVGLGANRLRTETAAVALLSLCMLMAE